MDFDILVPLFVSRLEGGPEATHGRLFSMNEDLFGRMQSNINQRSKFQADLRYALPSRPQ